LRPARILQSSGFRLAAVFALLFLACTAVLLTSVLWIIDETQRSELLRANDADIATVRNGFADEGVPEAVEVVKQRLGGSSSRVPHPEYFVVIQDAQGRALAGNLPALPPTVGILAFDLPSSADPRAVPAPRRVRESAMPPGRPVILGRGVEVTAGVYLFVGRDTTPLIAARQRILHAFLWVALGAACIALCGGLLLGVRFMRRVDAVASTCRAIIAGRFGERIPLTGRADEWDRLSGAINDMLDRIAALLDNLRQVSSDVAHDLRTPLTRMRNRLEEARARSSSTAEYSAAIDTAIEDMDQLFAMFSALLRISQVEAGTRLSTFSQVSLQDVLQNLHQLYLPVAEDHRQQLSATLCDAPCVHGDAELLTQMFSNVLENAIRHTPQGTHIRMSLEVAGDRLIAAVTDDGPGIDPSEHDKVLRRFYRVSSSRSAAGHGLGLALVAAIAQLHHAALSLASLQPGLRVAASFPLDSSALGVRR
jgi:signal transduction histidine kinase